MYNTKDSLGPGEGGIIPMHLRDILKQLTLHAFIKHGKKSQLGSMVVGAWQLATTLILQEGAMNDHKDENAKHLHEKNKNRSTIVAEREREREN